VIIGIDLGTTYSLAAVLRDGAVSIIPNALGAHLTPSAVALTDAGEIVVGAAARALSTLHPERAVLAWKRDMGTDRTWQLGVRRFTPQELSALVLASLKLDAERMLGVAVDEAVVTVPAYFDESQRRATRDDGAIAGLRVERIINEPTAAALSYGLHQRGRELRGVVLDLGGGTFDVTVLEIIEGVVEIQSSAGDARLGGEDFSDAIAGLVATRIGAAPERLQQSQAVSWARLRAACEDAKRALSSLEQAHIFVPELDLGGAVVDVDQIVSRPELDRLWEPIVDRMRKPILRALRDARVQPSGIDEILLVGGATRMPCVVRLAAQLFERMPSRSLPADEAVAMGAAVQAALKESATAVDDLVVTDIAPFTLGIAAASRFGTQHVTGIFSPIIERGTVIPASRVESFSTISDNQARSWWRSFRESTPPASRTRSSASTASRACRPGRRGRSRSRCGSHTT
jgi:molecular chaperone HscC